MQMDFIDGVERFMYRACREFAPEAAAASRTGLQKNTARFLEGSPDVPRGQVAQDLQRLNALLGALVAAVPQIWERLPVHLAPLQPDQIKESLSGGSMFRNKEADCWKKFIELSGELQRSAIERTVRTIVKDYVGSII